MYMYVYSIGFEGVKNMCNLFYELGKGYGEMFFILEE